MVARRSNGTPSLRSLGLTACAVASIAFAPVASVAPALGAPDMTGSAQASSAPAGSAPEVSPRPAARPDFAARPLPDLRWDHVDGSTRWTRATMRALERHGRDLVDTVPDDIGAWCPAYPEADRWTRKAFWAGLLSTLSKHESTYRPEAVGGDGLWYGLVQILPATARGYGCRARTGEALKDAASNMACAVRILNVTVPRDDVVSHGMRGVAADWGPFHSAEKREDMRRWTASQPFCSTRAASVAPPARPAWIGAPDAEPVPLFVSWQMDRDVLPRLRRAVADAFEESRLVGPAAETPQGG